MDASRRDHTVLLIDDQPIIAEAVKKMLEGHDDIAFHYCNSATAAIAMADALQPTLILQDLVMPDGDGLDLVKSFRAHSATRDIPLIVLSVKEDPQIKAEAFALGANDYSVKLPDKSEFIARIRYHSTAYTRLIERNVAYAQLEESQRALQRELAEAAEYVRSLLPDPIDSDLSASWHFIPSLILGGDAFGYHWIDADHFAIYLLDVSGHGVGAALLSSSLINAIRMETLPGTDFCDPAAVLTALNQTFPMEKHRDLFFTIWYGVYNRNERTLTYASGGHPPALLFSGPSAAEASRFDLSTSGVAIGVLGDNKYENRSCSIADYGRLYLFSDGVFELEESDGGVATFEQFAAKVNTLERQSSGGDILDALLNDAYNMSSGRPFGDDYSIIAFAFR